jgi:hypothetical protein
LGVQPSAAFALPIVRESLRQSYEPGHGQLKEVASIAMKHNKFTHLAAVPMAQMWVDSKSLVSKLAEIAPVPVQY